MAKTETTDEAPKKKSGLRAELAVLQKIAKAVEGVDDATVERALRFVAKSKGFDLVPVDRAVGA